MLSFIVLNHTVFSW